MRVGRRDVNLTKLDKVFFPVWARTGELVAYYLGVAPLALNQVARPLQMEARPDYLLIDLDGSTCARSRSW